MCLRGNFVLELSGALQSTPESTPFQSIPESRRAGVAFPRSFSPRISVFTVIGKDVAASKRRGNNFKGFETFTESQGQNLALTALSVPHSLDRSNGPLPTKPIPGTGFQTTGSYNTADALFFCRVVFQIFCPLGTILTAV